MDNNTVERAIRPLALTRKEALFAGSDGGADQLGDRRFLDRDLQARRRRASGLLTEVLTKIVNDHPNSRIDELLPWAYATQTEAAAVA